MAGWRQGFTSNITNPKVLVFYLAVLPQFLTPGAGLGWLLVLAWSHAVLSLGYLLMLVTGLHSARRLLMRRRVRRTLDATTGAVLLGFGSPAGHRPRLAARPRLRPLLRRRPDNVVFSVVLAGYPVGYISALARNVTIQVCS